GLGAVEFRQQSQQVPSEVAFDVRVVRVQVQFTDLLLSNEPDCPPVRGEDELANWSGGEVDRYQLLAPRHVPELHFTVAAAGRDRPPIRREGASAEVVHRSRNLSDGGERRPIAQDEFPYIPGCQERTVGGEAHGEFRGRKRCAGQDRAV